MSDTHPPTWAEFLVGDWLVPCDLRPYNSCSLCDLNYNIGEDIVYVQPCYHHYHRECLKNWFDSTPQKATNCPSNHTDLFGATSTWSQLYAAGPDGSMALHDLLRDNDPAHLPENDLKLSNKVRQILLKLDGPNDTDDQTNISRWYSTKDLRDHLVSHMLWMQKVSSAERPIIAQSFMDALIVLMDIHLVYELGAARTIRERLAWLRYRPVYIHARSGTDPPILREVKQKIAALSELHEIRDPGREVTVKDMYTSYLELVKHLTQALDLLAARLIPQEVEDQNPEHADPPGLTPADVRSFDHSVQLARMQLDKILKNELEDVWWLELENDRVRLGL